MTRSSVRESKAAYKLSPTADLLQQEQSLFPWQLARVRLYEVLVERLAESKGAGKSTGTRLNTEVRLSLGAKAVVGQLSVTFTYPNDESPTYRMHFTLEGMLVPVDSSTPLPTEEQLDKRLACTMLSLLWPYAREFAQDVMRRMEVPAFLLPTLAVQELQTLDEARLGAQVCEDGKA